MGDRLGTVQPRVLVGAARGAPRPGNQTSCTGLEFDTRSISDAHASRRSLIQTRLPGSLVLTASGGENRRPW